MTHSKPITSLAAAVAIPLAALVVAGCGGGGGSGASATAASPKTTSGRSATVGVAKTGLGKILVDSKGRTIYLFKKDQGAKSVCTGVCANDWPPVRASGKPTVGGGTNASMVAITRRSDGARQVTYHGHPLYLYEGDHKPGETNGQGLTAFGAGWYALTSAGNQVSGRASSSGGVSGY
jgi:predicted lipoprotein with Yx(FWY)xxD motif